MSNFFSGFTNEKPSSRGCAPRSNNIFGNYDQDESAMKKKENVRPISNIFAEPDQPAKNTNKPDRMKSNIFGDDSTKSDANLQNKKRLGTNTITGRPYEEEKEVKKEEEQEPEQIVKPIEHEPKLGDSPVQKVVHTSSKVLQPPGGRCHKLW
ncbi:unnamed protein product [Brachionus calyciflorus]|uniref:Microtubule-associated protein Jupiter n=1 Tax=Brachionus calyciflorus TaxID=104777 RepID=A0A814KL01_9BILA|nr:unnamed protein product [Brachionus calyciflorus]